MGEAVTSYCKGEIVWCMPRLTPFALRGLLAKLGPLGRGAVRRAPQDPTTQDADDEAERYRLVWAHSSRADDIRALAPSMVRPGNAPGAYPTPLMCERPPPTTRRKRAARR